MARTDRSRRERFNDVWEVVPTAAVSRLVGRIARIPVPPRLRHVLWGGVASGLGMNLEEMGASLNDYRSFDELFTRRLKPGARKGSDGATMIVSPADGKLTSLGAVTDETGVAVKGRTDQLQRWLGRADLPWRRPCTAVVYLSPRDYHRVHAPISGAVVGLTYRPGCLIPVNPRIVGDGTLVFGRNERLTCWLDTARGTVAVTLVGALCVGSIELSFNALRTNRTFFRKPIDLDLRDRPVVMPAGAELGMFHMGSSVVVAWEGEGFRCRTLHRDEAPIQVGQALGAWES